MITGVKHLNFQKDMLIYRPLCEVTHYKEEPVKEKMVKFDIPDEDEDSECADNEHAAEESKDGKKAIAHPKKKMRQVEKFVKDETDRKNLKEAVFENFNFIKDIYKYFAAYSMNPGEIPSISQFSLSDLCTQYKLLDGKYLSLKDLDINLIAAKTDKANLNQDNPLNPEKSLIRY